MGFLWKNRSDEEIEQVIERAANYILKYDLVEPAILFFESVKPVAPVGGRLGGASLAWLIPLIGFGIDDYFVVFREPKNIEKLLKIIEEKAEERKRVAQKDAEEEGRSRRRWRFW